MMAPLKFRWGKAGTKSIKSLLLMVATKLLDCSSDHHSHGMVALITCSVPWKRHSGSPLAWVVLSGRILSASLKSGSRRWEATEPLLAPSPTSVGQYSGTLTTKAERAPATVLTSGYWPTSTLTMRPRRKFQLQPRSIFASRLKSAAQVIIL